jgi:hypothetical protein
MQWLGCLTGWWFGGGRVGWLGWKLGDGDSGSRTGRPKIILEAMRIEPVTRDMESRLTTTSTVFTVLTWRVVCDLTGENGRVWKIRS